MRKATLAVSIVLFVMAVAYWFAADAIPQSRLAGQVGADGLPKLLGVVLGVLSLVLAGQTLYEMRRAAASEVGVAPAEDKNDEHETSDWGGHLRALGLIGIGIVYLLVLPHLGYLVSSGLLLGAVATYAGLRPSRATLMFMVGGGVGFYLIFVKVLQIPLPAGFWPGVLN
jgi:putative tricarboxylic transport membrane protein